ncbi:MAG: HEPN domain-containing protein [Candidatus Micrarchaeota archaeon]|nr:HEPN domain-containing protein [Candidatus Micrarchaeota archaeon]
MEQIYNLDELLGKGLIKRSVEDPAAVSGSIKIAERYLDLAERNMEINLFDAAFLLAYSSMFHAGRALLFAKGYKERGHYAVVVALKTIYKDDQGSRHLLELLNGYRLTRHAIQYNGDLGSEIDASEAIRDSEKIIECAKRLTSI